MAANSQTMMFDLTSHPSNGARAQSPSRFYVRAALLLLLVGWGLARFMVSLPPLEGTDEVAHFGYVVYLRQQGHLPPLETDNPIVLQETGQPPLYYLIAAAWSFLEPIYDWHSWQGQLPQNPWADFHKPVLSWDNVNLFMLGSDQIPSTESPGIERAVIWLRLPSLFMGLLTVACVLAAARRLFSSSTALFAALLFAFTITLLYIFSFVTNDALMTLTGTAVTYGCVRLLVRPVNNQRRRALPAARDFLLTGLIAAAGVLTKAGGLLFLPVIGITLFLCELSSRHGIFEYRRVSDPRLQTTRLTDRLFKSGIMLLMPSILSAALWYGYMLITYSDAFGMAAHLNRSWVRAEPIDMLTGLTQAEFLSFRSFWGGMAGGYLIPANWIFIGPLLALVLAGYGFSRMTSPPGPLAAKQRGGEKPPRHAMGRGWGGVILVLLLTGLLMLAAYARWMTQFYVLSGRLMLPGYLALILLVVMGLRYVPRFKIVRLFMAGWSVFVTLIYAGYLVYPQVYGVNLWSPENVPPLHGTPVRYGDIELMGYRITPERLTPGVLPEVELCWRSLRTDTRLAVPYAFSFQVADSSDTIYYRRESYPGMGTYTCWRPGLAFCDRFTAQAENPLLSARGYRILVKLVNPTAGAVLSPDDDGNGQTGLIAAPGEFIQAKDIAGAAANLDEVYLLSYAIQRYDDHIEIRAEWGTGNWQPRPVTVFWHVLDGETLVTQQDIPLTDVYPSVLWGQQERIGEVVYTISLPPEAAGKTLDIYMGVYNALDGQRLPVIVSQSPATPDHRILIAQLD